MNGKLNTMHFKNKNKLRAGQVTGNNSINICTAILASYLKIYRTNFNLRFRHFNLRSTHIPYRSNNLRTFSHV